MNRGILFSFLLFLNGCLASESIDETVEELLVVPAKNAHRQVDSAQQLRDQLDGMQREREMDMENIMNQ